MNYSFWENKYIQTKSDVTIIGSGIVGLSTAISIKEKQPWLSVKILERGSSPYGASTKNAGFACFGSVSELLDDIAVMGEDQSMEIVKMRWAGLQKLKSRLGEPSLEYNHCGGTELFRNSDQILMDECLDNLNYCNNLINNHLNISKCYNVVRENNFGSFKSFSIFNQFEGTINPVSMMNALIKIATKMDIMIINGVKVNAIDSPNKTLSVEENLEIGYNKLVICTNGFAVKLIPSLAVAPSRNQVLITKILPDNLLKSGYHLDKGYVYFRNYEGRILLGGGRNIDPIVEATDQFGTTILIREYLQSILETIYPGASSKIEHWWSGILGIGPTKYPICEWVDSDTLVGVRLGGMGVAIGSYLGEQLAEEIIRKT